MRIKFLHRFLTAALMVSAALSVSAAETTVDIVFGKAGLTNRQKLETLKFGEVTLTGDKGQISSVPEYYAQYEGIVFYGTNSLIVSSSKNISKIEFTTATVLPFDQDKVYSSVGGVLVKDASSAVWTNNVPVKEVTITPLSNSIANGMCITSMKVYLDDESGEQGTRAKQPLIKPLGGIINKSTDITITSEESGAVIYYTTDGTDPLKANGKRYSTPIHLGETSLVKAVAVVDGLLPSYEAGRGFVVPVSLSSLSDLKDAHAGVFYEISSDMEVTYCLGSTCWLRDKSGVIKVWGDIISNSRPASGWKISRIVGRFNLDRNTPELIDVTDFAVTQKDGPAAEPKVMKSTQISADDVNDYILVENAVLTDLGSYNYTLTDEAGTISVRNNYRISSKVIITGKKVNVYLFPAWYNSELRFYIANVIDPDAEPGNPDEPVKPDDGKTAKTAWTVSEAFEKGAKDFMKMEWVKGYIVGSFSQTVIGNFGGFVFGKEPAYPKTILLADSKDEKNPDKCLKISSIMNADVLEVTLAQNPDMLGKYVAFCGNMASNYQCMTVPTRYQIMPEGSGVEDIAIDNNAPATYYTLGGVLVDESNLVEGQIYICRQGAKCKKIVYRSER